jgi:predicted esterase
MSSLLPYKAIPELEVYYQGSALDAGAEPLLLYFALTAQESLTLDPFNQPLQPLNGLPLRIFSVTLPGHGTELDHREAMNVWANNPAVLLPFFASVCKLVDHLVNTGVAEKGKIALMGLSRGAFVALHVAADSPHVGAVCGFAPLTTLSTLSEFQEALTPKELDLAPKVPALASKKICFYIGNRDVRVSTDRCYALFRLLVEESYSQGHRTPPVELFLFPSIGHKGHGTPQTYFHEGGIWIRQLLS